MVAPPSVSNDDLMRNLGLAGSPSPDLNLAVTQGQGIVTTAVTKQASLQSQTQINSNNTTAPAAGNAVVTLTIPATGYYQCDVYVGFGATAETTAVDNFVFKNNGVTMGNGVLATPNVANSQSKYTIYIQGVSGNSLSINTSSAGSAGSIYKGTIAITRIA